MPPACKMYLFMYISTAGDKSCNWNLLSLFKIDALNSREVASCNAAGIVGEIERQSKCLHSSSLLATRSRVQSLGRALFHENRNLTFQTIFVLLICT
jgi:hypothetical protein